MTQPLTPTDKKQLRAKMWQSFSYHCTISLIISVISLTFAILLDIFQEYPLTSGITIFSGLAVMAWVLWKDIYPTYQDLKSGYKTVRRGTIEKKLETAKYGWSGNPAADANVQPRLLEYHIIVDGARYPVSADIYQQVVVGQKVWVCFASVSASFLGLLSLSEVKPD